MAKRGRPRKNPIPEGAGASAAEDSRIQTTGRFSNPDGEVRPANWGAVDVADELGTTDRLFGDAEGVPEEKPIRASAPTAAPDKPGSIFEDDEAGADQPAEPTDPSAEESPAPEPDAQPEDAEFLDITKIGTKKLKTKIDGQEAAYSLEEIVRNFQTNQHLGAVGNRLGEERRKLAEERQRFIEEREQFLRQRAGQTQPQPSAPQPGTVDPRVQALEQELAVLRQSVAPVAYENSWRALDSQLKAQGFDDLLAYKDRISAHVAGVEDDNLVRFYDTPEGVQQLYFRMKAEDLRKPQQPQTPAPSTAPRKQPPIVDVDSGRQASRGVIDDKAARYNELFKRWRENPEDRALGAQILRLKREMATSGR